MMEDTLSLAFFSFGKCCDLFLGEGEFRFVKIEQLHGFWVLHQMRFQSQTFLSSFFRNIAIVRWVYLSFHSNQTPLLILLKYKIKVRREYLIIGGCGFRFLVVWGVFWFGRFSSPGAFCEFLQGAVEVQIATTKQILGLWAQQSLRHSQTLLLYLNILARVRWVLKSFTSEFVMSLVIFRQFTIKSERKRLLRLLRWFVSFLEFHIQDSMHLNADNEIIWTAFDECMFIQWVQFCYLLLNGLLFEGDDDGFVVKAVAFIILFLYFPILLLKLLCLLYFTLILWEYFVGLILVLKICTAGFLWVLIFCYMGYFLFKRKVTQLGDGIIFFEFLLMILRVFVTLVKSDVPLKALPVKVVHASEEKVFIFYNQNMHRQNRAFRLQRVYTPAVAASFSFSSVYLCWFLLFLGVLCLNVGVFSTWLVGFYFLKETCDVGGVQFIYSLFSLIFFWSLLFFRNLWCIIFCLKVGGFWLFKGFLVFYYFIMPNPLFHVLPVTAVNQSGEELFFDFSQKMYRDDRLVRRGLQRGFISAAPVSDYYSSGYEIAPRFRESLGKLPAVGSRDVHLSPFSYLGKHTDAGFISHPHAVVKISESAFNSVNVGENSSRVMPAPVDENCLTNDPMVDFSTEDFSFLDDLEVAFDLPDSDPRLQGVAAVQGSALQYSCSSPDPAMKGKAKMDENVLLRPNKKVKFTIPSFTHVDIPLKGGSDKLTRLYDRENLSAMEHIAREAESVWKTLMLVKRDFIKVPNVQKQWERARLIGLCEKITEIKGDAVNMEVLAYATKADLWLEIAQQTGCHLKKK